MLLTAGPFIALKLFVDAADVHDAICPDLSTNVGDTKSGNVQECHLVSFFGAWRLPPGKHNTKAA